MRSYRYGTILTLVGILASCATVEKPPITLEAPVTVMEQRQAQKTVDLPTEKVLKRKVAVGRFTNETKYGKALLGGDIDPLGRQTSDMLSRRLVESGKFTVLERPDLGAVTSEQLLSHNAKLVGANTLIIGSLTEFGRQNTGQKGFLSKTKKQTAHARVEVRLVDVRTGQAYFAATGVGEASTEAGEIAGFGSAADYDATLNDKVIGVAISDLLSDIIAKLEARPWWTDVLKVQLPNVYISGGSQQGIGIGDTLTVVEAAETVVSRQSGFEIALPPRKAATIRITSQFGQNEAEGSVGEIVSGNLDGIPLEKLLVTEK